MKSAEQRRDHAAHLVSSNRPSTVMIVEKPIHRYKPTLQHQEQTSDDHPAIVFLTLLLFLTAETDILYKPKIDNCAGGK